MTERVKHESLGSVIKSYGFLIGAALLLLAASVGFMLYSRAAGASKPALHSKTEPVDFGLRPVEIMTEEEASGSVLTETQRADDSYFDDVLFVGDSLTEGIALYLSDSFTAVAVRGINTHTAQTNVITTDADGNPMTLIETIEYYKPNKVYIMLGTNGLNWESIQWNYDGFVELIDSITMRVPGCTIVIMSCTPKTQEAAAKVSNYTPESIAEYNGLLRDLAVSRGLYYLDIVPALADESGYLKAEYASSDGIHMVPEGYQALKEYIYTHVIKGNMSFIIGADGLMYHTTETASPDVIYAPAQSADGAAPAAPDVTAAADGTQDPSGTSGTQEPNAADGAQAPSGTENQGAENSAGSEEATVSADNPEAAPPTP